MDESINPDSKSCDSQSAQQNTGLQTDSSNVLNQKKLFINRIICVLFKRYSITVGQNQSFTLRCADYNQQSQESVLPYDGVAFQVC